MFGRDLLKHLREFRRYFTNHQWERSEEGVYFPKAHALLSGRYTHWVSGAPEFVATDSNIVPDEGLNHFLSVALKSGAQITTWYLGIHSGSGTPAASTAAANYHSTLTEISSGYTEANRVTWSGDAVDTVNTEVVNDASPAQFTISGSVAVNGAALISVSTKQSTSGTLLSAGKFAATRNLADTDVFNLKYKVDLDAA